MNQYHTQVMITQSSTYGALHLETDESPEQAEQVEQGDIVFRNLDESYSLGITLVNLAYSEISLKRNLSTLQTLQMTLLRNQ